MSVYLLITGCAGGGPLEAVFGPPPGPPPPSRAKQVMYNPDTGETAVCRHPQKPPGWAFWQKPPPSCIEQKRRRGFEEARHLPYRAAKYDQPHLRGYPGRRWREGESAPRW